MKRYHVRPSKSTSLMTFWICLGMAVFGFVLFVMLLGSGQLLGSLFLVIWMGATISIAVYHGKNAFGEKGEPYQHIEVEDSGAAGFDEELRRLKKLLDDGIITQAEFDDKKKEILGQQWR